LIFLNVGVGLGPYNLAGLKPDPTKNEFLTPRISLILYTRRVKNHPL